MECKVNLNADRQCCEPIKVEPYWNVKVERNCPFMTFALTKVEPYWNVKNGESLDVFTPADIKVEPYWNVKKEWKRQINNALELK